MPHPLRPTALLFATLLLPLLLLAACTSPDDPTATPTPSPTPTTEATPTSIASPTPSPTATPASSGARILPPGLLVRTSPNGARLGRLPAQERVTAVGRYTSPAPEEATWLGLEGLGWVRYHRNSIEVDTPLESLPAIDTHDPRPAAPLHPDDTPLYARISFCNRARARACAHVSCESRNRS